MVFTDVVFRSLCWLQRWLACRPSAGAGPYGASSVPLPDIIPVAYGLAPVPAVNGVVPPRVAVPPVAYAPGRPITYVGGPFPVT